MGYLGGAFYQGIHTVKWSCPTNKKVIVYEAETGTISNLNDIPQVGCFAIRFLDKLDKKDFKLLPANQAGVFIGPSILRSDMFSMP